ncbi:MAG: LLM class flavin-dependent oxidoreductase, partial [Chloroflexota bacterium]
GEVADGILLHPLTSERYVREKTLPAIERGLRLSGRQRKDFEVSLPVFVVDEDDGQAQTASRAVRQHIGFYGSTPAYRGVLAIHGWDALHTQLNVMSRANAWADMASAIDDDVLDAFAIRAPRSQVAERLLERYGDVVDRVSFYEGFEPDPPLIARLQAASQVRGGVSPAIEAATSSTMS